MYVILVILLADNDWRINGGAWIRLRIIITSRTPTRSHSHVLYAVYILFEASCVPVQPTHEQPPRRLVR